MGTDMRRACVTHRVIVDASARRFQAQKAFVRATAAVKYINRRRQLVPNGTQPSSSAKAGLQQAENQMRQVSMVRIPRDPEMHTLAPAFQSSKKSGLSTLSCV